VSLPNASEVTAILRGHTGADGSDAIVGPIAELHANNRRQWGREDDARASDADDAMVAAAKRDIDRLNGTRHRWIEAIDRSICETISLAPDAPLVTETPGMAIDRLSVLVIRIESTEARARSEESDADQFAQRLPRLHNQLEALQAALDTLFEDLTDGSRRFVAYESLKLYGPRARR
jgi:hypothetical protein